MPDQTAVKMAAPTKNPRVHGTSTRSDSSANGREASYGVKTTDFIGVSTWLIPSFAFSVEQSAQTQ